MSKKKVKWLKTVTRPGSPLKNTMLLRGLDLMFLKYTGKLGHLLLQGEKGTDVWYIDQERYGEFGKELIKEAKSLGYLRKLTKKTLKICDRFINTTKKLDSTTLKGKSNSELKRFFEEVHRTADDFPFVSWGFLILDSYLTDQLKQKLKDALERKSKKGNFQKYFTALTTKTRLVAAEEEEIKLLKIKTKLKEEGRTPKINALLESHSQKYAWLPVYDFALDPWDKEHFEHALEELTDKPKEELEKRKRHLEKSKKKIKEIIEELGDHELSDLVKIVQEFLVLRTYRTDALRRGYYNLKPFLKELAKRLKWDEKEVPFLSIDEIYAFLSNKSFPTHKEVKKRQKQVLVLKKKGYLITSDKKEIERILREELKLKKIKWIKTISRSITPQVLPFVTAPAVRFFEKLGAGFKNQLYLPENGKHGFYLDAREWQAFTGRVVGKIKGDENFLRDEITACIKDGKEFIKASKECGKSAQKKSKKALAKNYKDYLDKFEDFYVHMWVTHPIEDYLEDTLRKRLTEELEKRKKKDLFDRHLKVLTEKVGLIEAEKEQLEFLEIAIKVKVAHRRVSEKIDKLLDQHVERYGWLPFYSFELPVWDRKHFLDSLEAIKKPEQKLNKTKKELEEKREKLEKIKEKFKKNKKLLDLIDIVQEYLILRTDRADVFRKAIYSLRPFLFEVAKRAELRYIDIIYLTPPEIIDFLEKDRLPKRKLIKERQRHFLLLSKWGRVRLISEMKTIRRIIKEELGEEEIKLTKLEGETAFPGLVKGKVRIIKTIKDIKRVSKGDVLVTSMTTPDMTMGIHKAKAIVTDEGGITCHAAIVSRELKIPCVIATGNATKVLKEGDLVEVDAEKGVVRKL